MVAYYPARGDLVWINFDPQAGHEQAKRRPAIVISDSNYNQKSNLCVVCPVTSTDRRWPFAVEIQAEKVKGTILADQAKSMDWRARNAVFIAKMPLSFVEEVALKLSALILPEPVH